jgi:tRNA modification GTPase
MAGKELEFGDTIVAIATPPGEGGIGVVRLSGPAALAIATRLFRSNAGVDPNTFLSHTVHLGRAVEPESEETIDVALLTPFRAPHSYTGEEVVEISGHGSNLALIRLVEAALRQGARLAEPGEFTRRAFLNGRMDLAAAEAVADLIRARTDAALRVATRQLEGRLSRAIHAVRTDLISLLAEIEAAIDFPDDVEPPTPDDLIRRITSALDTVEQLLATADAGRLYREGAAIVIVGRPNVGKSSLLNALLRENRAIVTEIPGTTRDVIEESVNIRGIPLRAIDTAGLRETVDLVERIGVERTQREIETADLVLWVLDLSEPATEEDRQVRELLQGRPTLVVANKADLPPRLDLTAVVGQEATVVRTVAPSGDGIEMLEDAIAARLLGAGCPPGGRISSEEILVSNTRHRSRLENSAAALRQAIGTIEAGFEQAMVAVDLKIAAETLGEITGESVTEATISEIFARFCVGK